VSAALATGFSTVLATFLVAAFVALAITFST
jgi:hypothetical protein